MTMASYETEFIKKYMKEHPKSKSPLIKNIKKILKKTPKTRHNKPKKKPYFIPEPFGLPFELQPTGKFKKLSGKKKTKKKKVK